jgi:hypothetical protein
MAIAILGEAILGTMRLGFTNAPVWTEPKTDWKQTDRFNISDFNRIRENIQWLHRKAVKLYRKFEEEDMGEKIESHVAYWDVNHFNAFEKNIETINKEIYSSDIGITQTFFENGPFIKWEELNRIESACLNMKSVLDRQEMGMRRLSFRFGAMKGLEI